LGIFFQPGSMYEKPTMTSVQPIDTALWCEGLILLETYTTLRGQELIGRLPAFLNVTKEVTGNPAYSMFNLSFKEEWAPSKFKNENNCVDGAYTTIIET
ncbi:hypothetical protein AVEN_760-1, partial [Araneus ventricosus]